MNPLLELAIRVKLKRTSRDKATAQIRKEVEKTLAAAATLGEELSAKPCHVPKMPGVDEEMRDWSIYQLIEHNTIVNRIFADVIEAIAQEKEYVSDIDPKHDVLPSELPGPEVIEPFQQSVADYFKTLGNFPMLKNVGKWEHPVFGDFDARMTHAMCGFHLFLHRRQAERIVSILKFNG